jgi:general secretion pathway protein G
MNGSKNVIRKGANRGFTLIEILIVVVILGILAAIVIPQFSSASQEAAVSSVRSQLQTLRSQVELYRVQNNEYPATGAISSDSASNVPGGFQDLVDGGYLQRLPEVPAGWQINLADTGSITAEWIGTGDAPNGLTADQIADW